MQAPTWPRASNQRAFNTRVAHSLSVKVHLLCGFFLPRQLNRLLLVSYGFNFPNRNKRRIGLQQTCSSLGLMLSPFIILVRVLFILAFFTSKHNGLFILCSKHFKHIINFISFAGKRNTKLISESEILNYYYILPGKQTLYIKTIDICFQH